MEIREVTTFIEVARHKSFSKAAKKLGYSQAAVTIQIKQLEKELKVHLFDRLGKQIKLTHQGEVFYNYATEIIRSVELAKLAMTDGGELKGELRIGTIESICSTIFPKLLQKYHKLYPHVNVKVVTDSPPTLLEMMNRNEIDFVYIADEQVNHEKWTKVMEEAENVFFVASVNHELAKEKKVDLKDLIQYPFILTEKNASYRLLLDQLLIKKELKISPFLEISNTEYIVNQLIRNEGISFLPEFVIQSELEKGTLAILDVKDFSMQIWRQIIFHKDKWLTNEMKAFIQLAKNKR